MSTFLKGFATTYNIKVLIFFNTEIKLEDVGF